MDSCLPNTQNQIISQEVLDKLRSRVGPMQLLENTFNETASKEAIRKFADGIGDLNPLWREEKYARNTRYRGIVAPPSWLFSVFPGWISLEMSGIQATPSGLDIWFYRPVKIEDKIAVSHRFAKLDVRRNGTLVVENHEENYYDQNKALVAKAESWSFITRSIAERAAELQQAVMTPQLSKDDLEKIESEIRQETTRGEEVRYWEDTQVGEKLPAMVKGPIGLTDMVAYLIGAAPLHLTAHEATIYYLQDHPLIASRDPQTGSPERGGAVHYNASIAKAQSMRTGFCFGGQGQCWIIHMLTNWMGNDGWLKNNYVEYRGFINFSDVIRTQGTVTKKYIDENGESCADIETSGISQKGVNVLPGHSTVILPSKTRDLWPLNQRL